MFSISFPADQHYTSPSTGFVPTYENGKLIQGSKLRLVNLYAFNSSNTTVYLAVADSVDGTTIANAVPYPIGPGSFVSISIHGGDRYEKGLYLKAFTDTGLSAAAGNVMFYKVDWTAYL